MRQAVVALVALVVASLTAIACLRPSESRAERDLEVGHASGAGLRVDVAGGLAVVRELSSGMLRLWASAPTLEVTLERDADAPEQWDVLVDNCMPDAELSTDPRVGSVAIERDLATHCGWSVRLPEEQATRLTVRSPRAEPEASFRFGVLSDIQNAIDDVGDLYARLNQDPELAFVISAGDLTENGSAAQLARFQSALQALAVPFFSTLGNHELGTSPCRFHDYFGRGSLHFEFRGVHFTLLDSASATLDPLVYDWLDAWLEQGRGHAHVVGMHVPPVDPVGTRNGAFASRNEAAMLLAKLAEAGVDVTFYGHIHSYYHFDNAGIDAYVSGGGGALPERFDGIGRHYLSVDVDPQSGTTTVDVVRVD